ncbi:MAG: pyrophosphatase [Patescibacteria group bacterium]|jgi:NTP pyrophosphatase (non-canonical NTP hydrolase)
MDLKLLSAELAKVSDQYAKKFDIERNADWYILKLQEELGELIQSYLMMVKQARVKGKTDRELKDDFNKEVADVFGMVLLLARFHNVDLGKEIEEKWLKWIK